MTHEQIWMRRTGMMIAAVGAAFAILALPALHFIAWPFFQLTYWPLTDVPVDFVVPLGVAIAIGGGLTVGVGMMQWAVAKHVMPVAPEAGRKVVRISAWSWFVVDSLGSIATGATMNAGLNLIFLFMLLWPMKQGADAPLEQRAD